MLLEEFLCFLAPSTGWRRVDRYFCHSVSFLEDLYKPIAMPAPATIPATKLIFMAIALNSISGYILMRLSVAGFNNQRSLSNKSLCMLENVAANGLNAITPN